MRGRRLLWQLYPAYVLITLASLAGVTWYELGALREFYLARTVEDLAGRARLVEEPLQRAVAAREFSRVDELCKRLGQRASARITVILPDGKVVGDTDELPSAMDNHSDRPEIIKALTGRTGKSLRYSHTVQKQLQYVAIPIQDQGKTLGVLRVSIPVSTIDSALHAAYLRTALVGLAVAGLVAAASLLISRRIIGPLEQLQRGAQRFARGDLSYRLPIADTRETGALAETMNAMAAELDQRIRGLVAQRTEREAILSSMVEGVLAIDADQRLLDLNQAAARFLGAEVDRARGRGLQEVIRNPELNRLVERVLGEQQPAESEIVIRNGAERTLYVHGTVLRSAMDRDAGALVVLHDVTRLKKLEQVRRDFVANVSHELRTPVTAIKGFVETLLDGVPDPAEARRFLEIVASHADRLGAIIDDLLMLSRIEQESERAEIALAPGQVRGVLEAAIEVCRSKAGEKQIAMELACDEALEACINAALLEQAVVNLLDNAIKYSPAGQQVQVEAARAAGEVVICVRDCGCGISAEHLPRVFERFYRVDRARSRKLGGTGLGLAIVKHIAQAHRGRVGVESVVGQGSIFSVHLPLPEAEAS